MAVVTPTNLQPGQTVTARQPYRVRTSYTQPSPSQQQTIQGLINQPNLPPPQTFDPAQVQELEDAMYNRRMRLLEPQLNKQEARLQQRLANQGLPVGSEAYSEDIGLFEDSRNRAYSDAADWAVEAGNQELARRQAQDLAERGLLSQDALARLQAGLGYDVNLRQLLLQGEGLGLQREGLGLQRDRYALDSAFRERDWNFSSDMARRNQFFNEMGFFTGNNQGQPSIGMPQVPGIGTDGTYDTRGLTQYENQYNQYNADVNQSNQQNQMLMALASMFFLSSSKLKHDVHDVDGKRAAEIVAKVQPKRWKYKGTDVTFISPLLEQSPKEIREGDKLNLVNMVGTLWAALQDAQQRIAALEARNGA